MGFRGFSSPRTIEFAIQNGKEGSGLTIITGANNSGKSTIIECLRAKSTHDSPSFTMGARNPRVDEVTITYYENGQESIIKSKNKGGSESEKINCQNPIDVFSLSSRRAFQPYFHKGLYNRETYVKSSKLEPQRVAISQTFQYRLFNIIDDKERFNNLLYEVLGYSPEWSIDQSDQGQYFLKFYNGQYSHSSDGLGEGIISVFAIIDSLYDSKPDSVIAIDEPELSIHPALQKRLYSLLVKFSKDRQIIISTHSPYFIGVQEIVNGAALVRISNAKGEGITINQLKAESTNFLKKFNKPNIFNPHVFGLSSKEVFFQEDNLVLLEGQEDVILLPKVLDQLGLSLNGVFFGWGAGGAGNIEGLCHILKDLGFKRVAVILDQDQKNELQKLKAKFKKYHFTCIEANDIRTKEPRKATKKKEGLLDENLALHSKYIKPTTLMIQEINEYLN